MEPTRIQSTLGFGSQFTRLGKRLLLLYGTVYVLELLAHHWFKIALVPYLWLSPPGHPDFRVWQLVTHPFIHHPAAPFGFLISCLVFYFFVAPVEGYFGARRFLVFFYVAALGGLLGGLLFSGVSGFSGPFYGMLPSLLAVIVVFGLINPEATILLMFVLPVKAKYLSYGTVLITALTFLAKANPVGAFHLGGILFGWLYFRGWFNSLHPDLLHLKYLQWKLQRKKGRFTVIDGRKDKDKNDKPMIH